MSVLPLGRLFGLASVFWFAATLSAQLTTYTYQGKPFTTLVTTLDGTPRPFTTTDAVSGEVTFFSPLPPNQFPAVNVISNVASYSFTDGSAAIFGGPLATSVFGGSVTPVNTWNSTNSTMDAFIVGTDSQGQIVDWSTQIFFCCIFPVPPPPISGSISFTIFTCGGIANACASTGEDGASASQTVLGSGEPGIFELSTNLGSWGMAPTSCPMKVIPSIRQCASSLVPCQNSDGSPFALMYAEASAPNGGNLLQAAAACHFTSFEWQQKISHMPCPSGILPDLDTLIPAQNFCPPNDAFDGKDLTGTVDNPLFDPPRGGIQSDQKPGKPLYNPYPFFYPLKDVLSAELSPGSPSFCPPTAFVCLVTADNKLTLFDVPRGGWPATPASPKPEDCCFKELTTTLVGVSDLKVSDQSVLCGPNDSHFCTPLFHWTWNSTFNGTAGGVSLGNDLGINQDLPDPGSGTGGITITDLNGVLQTPPSLTCSATPTTLWPPDGKQVQVTVSGTVTAGTQAIADAGGEFSVADEYQQVQPIGSFTPGAGGSYSFTVPLVAARNGDDLDGRTYTIVAVARDNIGNAGSCSIVVTVPHDQGN